MKRSTCVKCPYCGAENKIMYETNDFQPERIVYCETDNIDSAVGCGDAFAVFARITINAEVFKIGCDKEKYEEATNE